MWKKEGRSLSKLLLFASVAAGLLHAQQTWNGFRFGMSDAEVQKMYEGTLRVVKQDDGQTALVDSAMRWRRRGINIDLVASVSFGLDGSQKLERTSIVVKEPLERDGKSDASGDTLAVLGLLAKTLPEQYGAAVSSKGECDLDLMPKMMVYDPGKPLSCEKMWRSEGQTIRML